MTEKHYLAASKRLKQGEYGTNPLWVLHDEVDALSYSYRLPNPATR